MDYLLYLSLAIFGLIFGSFLNVVTIRYNPDKGFSNIKSIGGRSHCPNCRNQLAWYELVPVLSFLSLRGRCRHCGHAISLQYPFVELLTALIFVVVPMQVILSSRILVLVDVNAHIGGIIALAALWTVAFVLFLVLAIIDFKHMIIPDSINVSLAVLGIAIAGVTQWVHGFGAFQGSFLRHYAVIFGFRDTIWMNHLFAAIIGLLFFGGIIAVSRGRAMGWGDLKLAGALGLLFGWPDVVLVFAFSFIIGSIISIGLMMRGRKHMKDAVPFGPFLVIGAVMVFFFGFQLVSLYFGMFDVI
ncbi:TPA: hypothetical protein DDZ49_04520 [Candidatus Wolfebacteria bacterium]|uniref:Prepilin peptidase, leader peptidase (Prepilin peptidase) / N-methyltransferase n=1 Tax=Candidatus Wolfebacteria bacterium GW2011_GWB1_47_1 TaxID=1619007 RepID=A0A0G4ASB3_9BACT|nr:MAG: prepilin peptidase, leader peptidase (prepilin peptidase) / N-methyltransferase [Candidatus Wolfebacteria bacterium GW2011_GWB1_47_1]HAL24598.1 hypothetical protein [Candidatus Wolfebacteria bacterium]HBD17824.1 hypothetical protein [Candidatus Wolfebacteria bacterium]HBN87394.1 hypothetical protein [Candidatus Wolfebacteria bacterium]HCM52344.1 hypothetical protein [Candidatus Wolfebacteria bacterium]